ncbi:hypothetical protein C8R47DRAFT_743577 [Mycena vitilis]|nr:hypothetical protein C8R47DRAFT_743577 [Mycena vitilis]
MSAPKLPVPELQDGPETWEATLTTFVKNLVMHELSQASTADQLLALFETPENLRAYSPAVFYFIACAELLDATVEDTRAGQHIALIAELFGLLRAEGLKRDPDGVFTLMTLFVGPMLRQLAHDVPVPPGYRIVGGSSMLEGDSEYVKGDSFQADLAEYARKHEGQLRLWSLVGRLDAHGLFPLGLWPLIFHQRLALLAGIEDPVNRGVWETLWVAVWHCEEGMGHGQWGSQPNSVQRLAGFMEAASTIAVDDRVPLLWRGRFAVCGFRLNIEFLTSCAAYPAVS